MPRILVIEDHQFTLDVVVDILRDEGYDDVIAVSFEPQLQFIEELHPDLIILDVMLQRQDGRILCELLKNVLKTVKIILFSAYLDSNVSAFAAGADGFLKKPFDIEDLLILVQKCINIDSVY